MENFAWFNGQKVAFTDGQTILQVAKQADIFIPTLCAFMPLNHTPGTCRMCLVEVFDEGDDKQPLWSSLHNTDQTRTKNLYAQ